MIAILRRDGAAVAGKMCVAAALAAGAMAGPHVASATEVIAVDRTLFPNTVVKYDTATPLDQTVINTTPRFISSLDYDAAAENLYAIDEAEKELLMVDDETGVFTYIADLSGLVHPQLPTGLAIDPTDGTFYVASTNFLLSSAIYTLDPTTGELTLVGMNGLNLTADIVIDTNGTMYALDSHTDSLYMIDKTDGSETLVGPTGFNAGLEHGMDFDYSDGTLYANIDMLGLSDSMRFVTIDVNTGQATEIARSNQENMNMAVKAPVAPVLQERGSSSEKGSLIIIPDVEVRWENVPPFNVVQDTFIHLTNDYPAAVDVKMYFVNGDAPEFSATWNGGPDGLLDAVMRERMSESRTGSPADIQQAGGGGGGGDTPRDHPGWNHLDNLITLTANEPAYWSAATGLPKGVSPWSVLDPDEAGPGRVDPDTAERFIRGFIIAFAVQQVPTGDEIRWNHLAADATIVNYLHEYAWQYNGSGYAVNTDTWAHGQATGTPGQLNLDGVEYGPSYDELLFNFIASGADAYSGGGVDILHDTDLTLMPVDTDLRQETTGPVVTKASFDIWNENEVKFTNLDRCVSCWDQELLSRHAIPNHFLVEALHTDAGKARIDGLSSALCPDSDAAALVGVIQKVLKFAAAGSAAGGNLHGLGTQAAIIRYDAADPPPESNGGAGGSFRR